MERRVAPVCFLILERFDTQRGENVSLTPPRDSAAL
jgi:hypothetical protein